MRASAKSYCYQPVELQPQAPRHAARTWTIWRAGVSAATPRQPLLGALVDPCRAGRELTFCFLVLGWQAGRAAQGDAATTLLNAVADWCRHAPRQRELGADGCAGQGPRASRSSRWKAEQTDELAEHGRAADRRVCDVRGGLSLRRPRSPGRRASASDLRAYFRNETICGCDDRYRETLSRVCCSARRKEMPFDEAVSTIRRGEPDNWGTLFAELQRTHQAAARGRRRITTRVSGACAMPADDRARSRRSN
jgi:hypothetical protein